MNFFDGTPSAPGDRLMHSRELISQHHNAQSPPQTESIVVYREDQMKIIN